MKKLLGYTCLVIALISISACTPEDLPATQSEQFDTTVYHNGNSSIEPKK
jgi:hypothetical protein